MATQMTTTGVKREKVVACMTCPLCDNLLVEATTISLCLHTFCRRCIYDKFSNEEVYSCPVCDTNLGAVPVDKLRADYNLQALRAKIFPYERVKESTPDVVVPSISAPVKVKERSLSSLVVSTPQLSIQIGKNSRSLVIRGALRGSGIDVDHGQIKKKENSAKDNVLKKFGRKDRQEQAQKADIWTPLNCLAEAVSRSESSKENLQGPSHVPLGQLPSATKGNGDSSDAGAAEVSTSRKQRRRKRKAADERNGSDLLPGHEKRRKIRAASWNRDAVTQELGADDEANEGRRNIPVWFMLVAAKDQQREVSLPQIDSSYLRIKDGGVPVSFIQKYLARKLNLSSESEVEIMCRDQPVLPAMQLHNLVDFWFRTTSTSRKIPAIVGAPANDFIMVLSYCRKVPAT